MSPDEGEDGVEKIVPDAEGKIKADEKGKYPEVVPWSKYVGIKESLGSKLDTERQKVTSLEEQLKKATSAEEFEKVKTELGEIKTKLQTTEEELTSTKNQSLTEKRSTLTKRGIPDEKVKDMSGKELDAMIVALGYSKPAPDMEGGSGGSGGITGSPMELSVKAYQK